MTQRDLAVLLDVTPGAVTKWEKGQEISGPAKKLLALLIHGAQPFQRDAEPDLASKHLLPAKLNFADWETLEDAARAEGHRTMRDYVQHWLKVKAAELRKGKA